jgi:hypothetical protein
MTNKVLAALALAGAVIASVAGYSYYLQTPNYALRQISDAAERQDQVRLAKYVDFDNIVAGLMVVIRQK